jgi:hypothetical protein
MQTISERIAGIDRQRLTITVPDHAPLVSLRNGWALPCGRDLVVIEKQAFGPAGVGTSPNLPSNCTALAGPLNSAEA